MIFRKAGCLQSLNQKLSVRQIRTFVAAIAGTTKKGVGGVFVLILILVGVWPALLLDVINNGVAAVLPAL